MKSTYARPALIAVVWMQFLSAGQAFAQTAGEASDSTIIVTARRVEERLQDVPISITVVSQDRLTKSNVTSTDDLIRVVPGLQAQSRYSSEQSTFSIRGFSQELRTSATVGTYFGEVIAPRGGGNSLQGGDGAGPGNLFDLQNVQVLKGPQGTLFGRNTTGGAVILAPRKPSDRFEGYVEGSYGNYDMRRLQGVVNLPIASWARLRLGADYLNRDGYLHNASGVGPRDFADSEYLALRGSLVLDLTSDLENYTIVSYLKSNGNGILPQISRANPASALGARVVPQVNRRLASGDRYQVEQKLLNPYVSTEQYQVINVTTLTASDSLTIKNIVSLSNVRQILRQDIFATNIQVPTVPPGYVSTAFAITPPGTSANNQDNFTEEFQIQGVLADSKLNYQAGLYYEHSTPGGLTGSSAPGVGSTCRLDLPLTTAVDLRCLNGGTAQFVTGTIEFINMAAYAQATYALTDQLKATGGFRYTYDRSRGVATGIAYRFVGAPGQYVAPIVDTRVSPIGCQISFAIYPNCNAVLRSSDKKPTWLLNLSYSPNDDMMFYATYARGYRQGAVTPFAPRGNPIFGPEKVDNYEIGAKASFRGDISGNLNVAAFYNDLTNQQIQVGLTSTSGNGSATSIYNAGKSRISGFDVDGSLVFSRAFRIDASATYLSTKLKSIVLPASFPGYEIVLPAALAGDPLNFSPKLSANVSGTVTLPTAESFGQVELTALFRHTASYASSASSNATAGGTVRTTPVNQLDLNVDWRNIAGQPFDLGFFATNVTGQFTTTFVQPIFGSFGFDTIQLGKPRMYGVRARVRFGAGS